MYVRAKHNGKSENTTKQKTQQQNRKHNGKSENTTHKPNRKSAVPRPLEGQVLEVKRGHMKHKFETPYRNMSYNLTSWMVANHILKECSMESQHTI